MRLRHVCEVCGKEEILSPEEAYDRGWDYPPKMGAFGVISPRTCGNCNITDTLWWQIAVKKRDVRELSKSQLDTFVRILNEPASILASEEDDEEDN